MKLQFAQGSVPCLSRAVESGTERISCIQEVNTPGLGLSQHLSVLQTGGTEKGGRTYFYAEQHRHTQLEHYMLSQLRAAHAQPAGTAHAQPA